MIKNILFLASWYPNPEQPQNGNFIERHAQAVGRLANVAVLYVHSRKEASDFDIQITKNKDITECRVYFPKSGRLQPFKKFQNYKKAHQKGYEKLLETFKSFDCCHLNVFFPAGIFALWLKKKYDIPYIITEHWTKFLPINPGTFSLVEKYFIKKIGNEAAMICPVSDDLKKAIQPFVNHNRFTVIPNVVDTRLFSIKTQWKDPVRILHISTLYDAHKNTTGMLRVLAKLAQERDDFTVTMIGNHYGDTYINMASELGISADRITILPEIQLKEVAQKMPEHDIFLLFSHYENLPCVISEAHVCGVPVVSSNVGGIAEMVDASNGRLVTANDEVGLLKTLSETIDNLNKYDIQKISENARNRYSYEAVGEKFLEIYQSITLDNRNI